MVAFLILEERKMGRKRRLTSICAVALLLVSWTAPTAQTAARMIADGAGRAVQIPQNIEHVICSGPGALRLLTYLESQDKIVAVDDMEKRRRRFDARPYALANRQFGDYPIFGEFRGHDNPERILALDPMPQVIFKTYPGMGYDPVELSSKTGIPVIVLNYGDLGKHRRDFYQSLRIMGTVMAKRQRAEAVIAFFDSAIADLKKRVADIPADKRPTCFVGGVAFKGPHGFQSTEPAYPPFQFVKARNLAYDASMAAKTLRHSNIAKEKIVAWDPDYLFLDLATLQMGDKAGGLFELKTDAAYQALTAVKSGQVYGLLPYNWYTRNFGSILANAYFIGKLLYPQNFADIDPAAMADEIYSFLVGKPVFEKMNAAFGNLAFKPVPLKPE